MSKRRRTEAEVKLADDLGRERRDAGTLGIDSGYAFRARTQIELRSKEGAKMPGLRFYTAVFNSWSEPLGFFEDFREKVADTAFNKTIIESDIRALFNHESSNIFGRRRGISADTLRLGVDTTGLEGEVDELPDSTLGRDLAAMVERQDVDGCSFGFRTIADSWTANRPADAPTEEEDREQGVTILEWRTLDEVRLFDVGPVTYPAYPETTAEVRSKIAGLRAAHRSGAEPGVWLRSYKHRLAELERAGGVPLG